ncbi:glucoamylase [Saccharothrix coeruleofusca]|uniref:glycoside hydrolase family 15 protein n=1 Tax=Saccharothrix coeruleofusca TaxID=33919 RepID=UPI001AE73F62|nr:glycoside hydrolase family 15 protein [Saccharothrix coeruleofusca]MBP2339683.1 glucoamylase [Saccharothrix coeruleofusca]
MTPLSLVTVMLASTLAAAPGAPGAPAVYTPADKQGFGTARSADSPVWFTIGRTGLNEVFYPDLSTPATRELQLVVTDGRTFVERTGDARTTPVGNLRYRQEFRGTGWRARVEYTTDPAGAAVLADVAVEAERPVKVYAVHDPALSREGADDSARTEGGALVATDAAGASALVARGGFAATSNGFRDTSDGWTDLADKRLDWTYPEAGPGNVVQTGELRVDGVRHRDTTLALGFGGTGAEAARTARASLESGFSRAARAYDRGWTDYLKTLKRPEVADRALYDTSLMVLAATEDKRHPGAFVASPSFPWAFGFDRTIAPEFGSYALVWPRDQYQVATALIAAGDRAAADRALDYMLRVQQQPDGHLPQNTRVDGTPYWTNVQQDEQAAPMLLAWLLGRTDPSTLDGLRRAAEFMVNYPNAPFTEQERWENQSGYSPATIAAEVAGLVCLADLLRAAGDTTAADRYLAVADQWEARIESWTATNTGPYGPKPYYLRLTKDGQPDAGTAYNLGDNNPGEIDQRAVVDPSFLELVRLGLRAPDDPVVRNTVAVVDRQLRNGPFWYRFTGDGFGERADGGPWNLGQGRTYGRLWPIFSGERGEYELLLGDRRAARQRLADIASTANSGRMLPEQVWDDRAPHRRYGTGTGSATPLAWTHAQYVRLAWSIEAGAPVERPAVVACRYTATSC